MSREAAELDEITRDELAQAYLIVQQRFEEKGLIPPRGESVLTRNQRLLEILGAVHLGLLVAVITILFNFMVVNFFLHLPPS